MEILNVLVTKILDAAVVLLVNVAVSSDIKGVATIVGRSCVDFDSVMLVDNTAKVSENWLKQVGSLLIIKINYPKGI